MKALPLRLDDELHRRAKVAAASERVSLNAVLTDLLRRYVEQVEEEHPEAPYQPEPDETLTASSPTGQEPEPPSPPAEIRPESSGSPPRQPPSPFQPPPSALAAENAPEPSGLLYASGSCPRKVRRGEVCSLCLEVHKS